MFCFMLMKLYSNYFCVVDGVRFVIDTGKAKKMRYSHLLRTMTLREEDVAQSSTKQRKGRAGRTQTGWVYYLFSKQAHDQMEEVCDHLFSLTFHCVRMSSHSFQI